MWNRHDLVKLFLIIYDFDIIKLKTKQKNLENYNFMWKARKKL